MRETAEARSARWERELTDTGRVVFPAKRRRAVTGLLISVPFVAGGIDALVQHAWLLAALTVPVFGGIACLFVYMLAKGLPAYVVDAEGIGWQELGGRGGPFPWSDVADLRCDWVWWNWYGPVQILLTRRAWADYLATRTRRSRRTAGPDRRPRLRRVVVSPVGTAHSKEVVDWLTATFPVGYGSHVVGRGHGHAGTPESP